MPATVSEQRDALAQLDTELTLSLLDVLDSAPGDPVAAQAFIQEHCPRVILAFADAAGSLAADWYDELRDLVGADPFSASPTLPAGFEERVQGNVGWSTASLVTGAAIGFVALRLAGSATRALADAHRATVADAAAADPAARGWARYGNGSACEFCRVLIHRGGVYKPDMKFASHDNCLCLAGPSFEDARAVDKYVPSRRTIGPAEQVRRKERLDAWVQANL